MSLEAKADVLVCEPRNCNGQAITKAPLRSNGGLATVERVWTTFFLDANFWGSANRRRDFPPLKVDFENVFAQVRRT